MSKGTRSERSRLPDFAPEKTARTGELKATAKLTVRRMSVNDLLPYVKDRLTAALSANPELRQVKGTLTFYALPE